MLVITRKNNESILIEIPCPENLTNSANAEKRTVEIMVLETTKDKVRLGVKAPREIKIMRNELVIVKTSNVQASQAVSKDAFNALLKLQNNKK